MLRKTSNAEHEAKKEVPASALGFSADDGCLMDVSSYAHNAMVKPGFCQEGSVLQSSCSRNIAA